MKLMGVLFLTLSAETPASSVFVIVPDVLSQAGTGALLSLLFAALIAVCMAQVYGELSSAFPIAGGEYVYGIAPFRQMFQNHSVDIVMIDIVRAGGVTQWMKIAGMAEAFNLPVVSHVMPEILCHMVAAIPNGLTVEYMPWMLALYEETPAIEDGMLVLPEKPGLGLKFDEKALASFKVG